ncbi:putative purine-cytosine permease fcy22 [Rosellinia necatrix]|uniref:Putative purine-cytosine permease fcy22 n=1 Tax=Rosellinia necatrix TaxID=77044 RepID=A0A1W2TEY0_ROSNE|nr:putative purine-cytosine permease fcy22 [Rosellinia necatrix]
MMTASLPTQPGSSHNAVVPDDPEDSEKGVNGDGAQGDPTPPRGLRATVLKYLSAGPVELRGVLPVPLEERTSTQYSTYFSIFFCMNINLLPITFGMLGPTYGLGLRDCALVATFFCLLTAAAPAYLGTLGPKTGMRQMVQARFSFGRYGAAVPVVLNLATMTGFCVISCVVGGQCLSAVSAGALTPVAGIVLIGALSLLISFCGYDVLHAYDRFAWIPALAAIAVTTGYGGAQLARQVPAPPATPAGVLSFGMIIASFMMPFSTLSSDYTTYLNPRFPSWRLFLYGFTGLVAPTIPLVVLGAAIGGAIAEVPAWQRGYETNAVGGVLAAMLGPAGGFGRFVVVVLSLSVLGNMAGTMYSMTLNCQLLLASSSPGALLARLPRCAFSVAITAVVVPVSVAAAADFFLSLQYFIALIAYWTAAFVAVVAAEHLLFRRARHDAYDRRAWDDPARLPWGAAALAASALSFALVVPAIAEVWFTGPIAERTGDLGFELAFAATALLYLPFRALEKRLSGR